MKKILIIKTGETFPSLASKRGDFEHWILAGMQIGIELVTIVDVRDDDQLPDYEAVTGVVITAAHPHVTEHPDWSERTAAWLPSAVEKGIPTLGICYGHQLLAYALGGSIGYNPNGREFGTVEIQLRTNAHDDRLLGGLASPLRVQVAHAQSVLRLPDGARLLASSARERNQAFVVDECAWGVQFHPEFDAEIVREYVLHYRHDLTAEGQDVHSLLVGCQETPLGSEILRRFAKIVQERS